jgi:hypothetical protein
MAGGAIAVFLLVGIAYCLGYRRGFLKGQMDTWQWVDSEKARELQ